MLQNIHVKNMALIDEADVDFGGHLNILTGETGAGKSIIIGSISTALGGKVSRDVIRKDAEYALVELNFKVNSPQILAELEKWKYRWMGMRWSSPGGLPAAGVWQELMENWYHCLFSGRRRHF